MSVDFIPSEDGTSSTVTGLRPATTHLCSIRAENEVGLSISSHKIEVRTEEEGKKKQETQRRNREKYCSHEKKKTRVTYKKMSGKREKNETEQSSSKCMR